MVKYYEDYYNINLNINYPYLIQNHHSEDVLMCKYFDNTDVLASDSWLASRYMEANQMYSNFGMYYIYNSGATYYRSLCMVLNDNSDFRGSISFALAPVVSLESGIKIDISLGCEGTKEKPWQLVK